MKTTILASIGFVALMSSACHKTAPVAATRPPDPTPVPAAEPQRQQPAQRAANNTPAPTRREEAPAPKTMPREVREALNAKLERLGDALFDYDKATIRDDARTKLRDDVGVIRDILANYPSQKLLIEGHCDERGSEEYNMALGDRRAKAAEEFLSSMGIPNNQLTIISLGKDRPVCTDKTEECFQRNRRAHLTAAP
jgi:peptidoglycan-associated lipoprotein